MFRFKSTVRKAALFSAIPGTILGYSLSISHCDSKLSSIPHEKDETFVNWSDTHSTQPDVVYYPESNDDISTILKSYSQSNRRIRPIGSALSPNGLGFNGKRGSLISLSNFNKIKVDPVQRTVTVGAGVRVSDILKALKPFKLTLSNFSSIQEQQIGGWTQVAAHGTGRSFSTVDEMIVGMKVITPSHGLLSLSGKDSIEPPSDSIGNKVLSQFDKDLQSTTSTLFNWFKVGLGALGVVTELTLSCVPELRLKEETYVLTRSEVAKDHRRRLLENRHVRYMWIPYTPYVVVVVSNPTDADFTSPATARLVELLSTLDSKLDIEAARLLSVAELRDRLLAHGPAHVPLIKAINTAEAEYWKEAVGTRVDDSVNILGFDCGGPQRVYEVCFPITGKLTTPTISKSESMQKDEDSVESQSFLGIGASQDITLVLKLLEQIESSGMPAPSPIEQRWTAASSSPLSPAYSIDHLDEIFSWVGVIMYLPPNRVDTTLDASLTEAAKFSEYSALVDRVITSQLHAAPHWAKIELPNQNLLESSNPEYFKVERDRWEKLRDLIRKRYSIQEFNSIRNHFDPQSILGNELIDAIFGDGKSDKL